GGVVAGPVVYGPDRLVYVQRPLDGQPRMARPADLRRQLIRRLPARLGQRHPNAGSGQILGLGGLARLGLLYSRHLADDAAAHAHLWSALRIPEPVEVPERNGDHARPEEQQARDSVRWERARNAARRIVDALGCLPVRDDGAGGAAQGLPDSGQERLGAARGLRVAAVREDDSRRSPRGEPPPQPPRPPRVRRPRSARTPPRAVHTPTRTRQ